MLHLKHISVSISNKLILDDINLDIGRGEMVTIIGPNGAGKSTLVGVVLGLIKPTSGKIIKDSPIKFGYMPQKCVIGNLLPLTVLRFLKLTSQRKSQVLNHTIEELHLHKILNSPMQSLSGGETQRVLLARALLQEPDLLVLDEPAQGVDFSGQAELYNLISNVRKVRNCSVLLISHDLHIVMSSTEKVICLNQHICCSGHPQTVSQHPAYLNLFGEWQSNFAVYHHTHNHQHPWRE